MSLKDKVNDAKERAEEVLEEGEGIFRKVKKAAYTGAATLEQKIKKREGAVGKVLAGAGDVIEDVSGKVKVKATEMHEQIMAEGGYKEAAKRTGKALKKTAVDTYDFLSGTYKKLEKTVTTKGRYDPDKIKKVLKDKRKVTTDFGEKTVKNLVQILHDFGKGISRDYRKDFPSPEELKTTYAGMGAAYKGVMLREDLDACLEFYEKTRKKLPGRLKARQNILDDIKASLSTNPNELKQFYTDDKTAESQDLLKTVRKYIK